MASIEQTDGLHIGEGFSRERKTDYPFMLFSCRGRNFWDHFQELFSKSRCNRVLNNHAFRLLQYNNIQLLCYVVSLSQI